MKKTPFFVGIVGHKKSGKTSLIEILTKELKSRAVFTGLGYEDEGFKNDIFRKCDFVFIEGDTHSGYPKIYVADDNKLRDDINGKIVAVWGKQIELEGVPNFNLSSIDDFCVFLQTLKNSDL
ncbi:MAG: hypothetical protein B6D58_01130 [candidate division Zixibacteria bacterium 4484_95]|nr:MAG: hypothetical protein B6D58_01130 [candidate division Zixibacteria bacterium 4484_95]